MRELELKDIACYVPYKPKCNVMGGCDDDGNAIVYTVTGCDNDRNGNWVFVSDDGVENCEALEDIFLLLRPMSDLAKETTVEGHNNGEPFVPMIELGFVAFGYMCVLIDNKLRLGYENRDSWFWSNGDFYLEQQEPDYYTNVSYRKVYDLLNQWHFDYRNLIGQGLAVDINTLNS